MLECQHINLLPDNAGFKNFDPTLTTNAGNAYAIPYPTRLSHSHAPIRSEYYIQTWYLVFTASVLCDLEDLVRSTWFKGSFWSGIHPNDWQYKLSVVILDFSPSFSCKPRSQCSSANSSSLSFCSLQSLQTRCPPRSPLVMIPNAIMIAARYAIPSMAPTKTLASESKSYLIVININTNWLLFDCSNCTCVSMVNDTQ